MSSALEPQRRLEAYRTVLADLTRTVERSQDQLAAVKRKNDRLMSTAQILPEPQVSSSSDVDAGRVAALEEELEHVEKSCVSLRRDLAAKTEEALALQERVDRMVDPSEIQEIVDKRDAALNERDDLASDLAEAEAKLEESERLRVKMQERFDRAQIERGEQSAKVAELMRSIEKLKAAQAAVPDESLVGDLARTVAERDEARAALKRAETARKTAEQAEEAALAGLDKTEKQLTATVSALQKQERVAEELDRQLAKASGQLARLRESNLTLTEQTKRIPELEKELEALAYREVPAEAVDFTSLRASIAAAVKWLEKDELEKMQRSLSSALQELNRLEDK